MCSSCCVTLTTLCSLLCACQDELQGSEESYDACRNPDNIKSWMDWQTCIEVGQPSCVFMMSRAANDICRDRFNKLLDQIQVTDTLTFSRKLFLRSQVPLFCQVCQWSGSYKTDFGLPVATDALHSLTHLVLGGDFGDVMASPNDVAAFFGYHGNIGE